MTRKKELKGPQEVEKVEHIFNESDWLRGNTLEPVIGGPSCSQEVEEYGIGGASCYTALVKDNEDATYGCHYERCYPFRFPSLEEAIRHQRYHHFDHRPYECTTLLIGGIW